MTDIEQARVHHQAGRLQQAEAIYRQILSAQPDHPDALHLLGVIALQAGKHEVAAKLIREAIAVNPSVPAYHTNLGEALRALKRLDDAVAAYERALALRPNLAEAHNSLGMVLLEQGQPTNAVPAFRRAVSIEPDRADAHYNLGNALHESGKREEAIVAYRQALALKPDDVDAYNNMGIALKDEGRLAEAVTAFEQALALQPDAANIYINLASALEEQGRLSEAVTAYKQAVVLKPDMAHVYAKLGTAFRAQGQMQEAVAAYQQALALEPNDAKIHHRLGLVLQQQGRPAEAITAYEQALALLPDYAEAYSNLGTALAALGKLEQGVNAFRHALRKKPDLIKARRGLVYTLRFAQPARYDPDLENELKQCFGSPVINSQDLARASASQLKHKYPVQLPLTPADAHALVADLGADELLLAFLTKTVNVDAELELLLTDIRRILFFDHLDAAEIPEKCVRLIVALGLQCFSNEYVFNVKSDEAKAVDQLRQCFGRLAENHPVPSPELVNRLLLLAMYQPLYTLACAPVLSTTALNAWPASVRPLIKRVLKEPLDEAAIEGRIESLGEIEDVTSRAVRAQYEQYPYPRWLDLPRTSRATLGAFLRQAFPHFTSSEFLDGPTQTLVAGCGTGREPIGIARACEDIEIVAVDLSRRSLAYAMRMACKLDVGNVRFIHGDILDLPRLNQRFHMIECGGVLHHMADPLGSWRVLTKLLVFGGVMKIGLYSEQAREGVVAARTQICQQGLSAVPEDIKAFRTQILTGDVGPAVAELADSEDFYTLSACRDLLFHTQEQRFTLSQIRQALDALGLEFIGFELPAPQTKQRYRELFPQDEHMVDLSAWEKFENLHPQTFAGMYVFWCQKISSE